MGPRYGLVSSLTCTASRDVTGAPNSNKIRYFFGMFQRFFTLGLRGRTPRFLWVHQEKRDLHLLPWPRTHSPSLMTTKLSEGTSSQRIPWQEASRSHVSKWSCVCPPIKWACVNIMIAKYPSRFNHEKRTQDTMYCPSRDPGRRTSPIHLDQWRIFSRKKNIFYQLLGALT